jgi:hypothetical protein
MARSQSLLSPEPTNVVHQPVTISHVFVSFPPSNPIPLVSRFPNYRQLRDLIICPDERGVVNYVQDQCIMEHDISDPSSVSLYFPFSLSRLPLLRAAPFLVAKKKERNGSLEKKRGSEW